MLQIDVILKEIDIKRRELNSLAHDAADYHSGDVLEKSQELDKLITAFYEIKQREKFEVN